VNKVYVMLLLVLGSLSCSSESEKIQGVWMGAYIAHEVENELVAHQIYPVLYDFSEDTIVIKKFYNGFDDYPMIKAPYKFVDNILTFGSDSLLLTAYNSDTLTFENIRSNEIITFRKINEKTTIAPRFKEGLYHYRIDDYRDTLQFLGENQLMRLNNHHVYNGNIYDWSVSEYKALNFFMIHGQFEVPLLITGQNGDNITFKTFFRKEEENTLEFLPDYKTDKDISGNWTLIDRKQAYYFNNYFDKSTAVDTTSNPSELLITEDSITINMIGKERSFSYWLSLNKTHLIINLEDELKEFNQWELEREADKLFITSFLEPFYGRKIHFSK